MTDGHCFISYSNVDGLDFATKLADELEGGHPFINVWFDKRDLRSEEDWRLELAEAIKTCKCMFFVMTQDSVIDNSTCAEEWDWALRYKKPVVPLRLHTDIQVPFGLGRRQWIDFSNNFEAGLAKLRKYVATLDSPEGILQALNDRLKDAERDLRRARPESEPRIKAEIAELTKQIKRQEEIVKNPKAAEEKTEKNIQSGLERERQPEKPIAGKATTKFINPPPGIAPTYFQDRYFDEQEIVKFLNNDAQRLLTIVGRAGVGKTAMVCRLLKGLERGELPDDLGEMKVDGIVYLSETGSHRVNFANVFAGLSKLLPKETAESLEGLYKDPKTSTGDKMRALLDAFPTGRVVLLLDNFENLVDDVSLSLRDSELSDALNVLLTAPHHAVKVVLTTRIAPRDLAMVEPGRQHALSLDEGLESPYAENVLREMDADGRVGLKTAPDALLNKAREKTRGYPRALEALYAILSVDRYTTLEELLEMKLPKEVVEKLVGEAFNRLDPNAQKVMQALAVYNRPVGPAAIDYLLQPHLPSIDSALVLNRLVNMHFARREAGRYYLHPADKEYAFGIIPQTNLTPPAPLPLQGRGAGGVRSAFTQHDLLNRAADYFAQARKPRTEWKKLDDLAAQLAEFELRCAAGDYDTAADVLTDIDFDYLLLWGHYRLMIELHTKIKAKIKDITLGQINLGNLGNAYFYMGNFQEAIVNYELTLSGAREAKNRQHEGAALGHLGNCYANLGDALKAIELYEGALIIAREIGNRKNEGAWLGNLGIAYSDLGDIRNAIKFHEQQLVISREIGDRRGEGIALGNLGNRYAALGDERKAIEVCEQRLMIAREIGDRDGEGSTLGNLVNRYAELGETLKAIEFSEQALIIHRETSNRRSESINLENIGHAFLSLEEYQKAEENFKQAIQIADGISFPQTQNYARLGLAQTYLFQNDLANARATIEAALKYDMPENNHNTTALHGIIALRQGDVSVARQAFTRAIAQADEILAKTPDYFDALDAKGLALCGLALTTGDSHLRGDCYLQAIESFRAARKIAPHAGVVKRVLRLFDELGQCDQEGALAEVRKAAEGKE